MFNPFDPSKFYPSKFYEFAYTWLLVLKNKLPSFLQKYHHAGIVITMWAGVATSSNWLVWPSISTSLEIVKAELTVVCMLMTRNPLRPMFIKAQDITTNHVMNWVSQIAFDVVIFYLWGWRPLFSFVLCIRVVHADYADCLIVCGLFLVGI